MRGRLVAAVKVVVFLAIFTLLSVSWKVEAAVINAASCSQANVATAVAMASDGDTVQVPAGTCTWSSTLTVTRGITLAGAGIDQTIIRDDVPRTGGGRVIEFDTGLGVNWRLTGFTFRSGTVTDWNWNGLLLVAGRSHAFRIDHVKVDNPNATAIRLYGDARGVIDHSQFYTTKNGQFMVVNHTSWNGVGSFGDNSWASPTALGTADAVYFEDNTFTVVGVMQTVIDSTGGGRYVARNNAFDNAAAGGHGADSSQRNRSLRSYEFYNNTFTYPGTDGFAAIYVRGGTGVVFNNTFSGFTSGFRAANYRTGQPYAPWGRCNGTSPYDGNSGSPAGYPCIDQVGRGDGDLLSGDTPSPAAWPNQALEPVYVWGNVMNGSVVSSQHAHVQLGRDVLVDTPKPGYQPFTYPHPLVTGAPPPPPPSPADTLDLSVSKSGTGSGTVTSSPAGINCGMDCSESYPGGTVVTLTATPASGSIFSGWTGGCTATDPCTISGNTPVTVTATFSPAAYTVTIAKAGTGSGTVTSQPAGLTCGATCQASFTSGTTVALTATPASGSAFAGWSGNADCTDGSLTMSGARNCTATFNTAPQQPVEIIIDNGQAGTTPYGKWAISTAAGSYGQSSLYSSGRKIDRYVWTPTLPSVGQYEVWVWWTSNSNRSSNTDYKVRHASATATLTRDQRTGGSQWQLLGTYQFNAGTEGWVQVSDKNGGTISADAVRFVKK